MFEHTGLTKSAKNMRRDVYRMKNESKNFLQNVALYPYNIQKSLQK